MKTLRAFLAFLLLASLGLAQSFPVKTNSSGAVTEPSNLALTGSNISATANLTVGNSTVSTNSSGGYATLAVTNPSIAAGNWLLRVGGSGVTFPGYFELYNSTNLLSTLRVNPTTGQPTFPFLATDGVPVTDAAGALSVVAKGANSTFFGINGSGVKGFYAASGTLSGLTTNGFTYANGSASIASTAATTNGQILIGSNAAAPVAATITGTANRVTVTNGAGTITLSGPQDLGTGSTPTFAGATLNGTATVTGAEVQVDNNRGFSGKNLAATSRQLLVLASDNNTYMTAQDGLLLMRTGAGAVTGLTLSASQLLRLNAYGAGTLTSDASGNVTAVSDERLKDIDGNYTAGLAELLKVQPISYKWKESTGLDRSRSYKGFSAQNLQAVLPEAVGKGADGYLTLQDRPILAALVNATKELAAENEKLKTRLAKLESHWWNR